MPNSPYNVQRTLRRERMDVAFKMRKKGHTVYEIADAIGMHESTVRDYLRDSCKLWMEHHAEQVGFYLALDLSRLDSYLIAMAAKLEEGNSNAVLAALEILKLRGKILGYTLKQGGQINPNQNIPEKVTDILKRLEAESSSLDAK